MKKNWIYSIALPVLFLVSCGGAEDANEVKKEAPGATPETSQTVPTYSAVEGTEVIKWTGFKLAEKVGVDGKFETFELCLSFAVLTHLFNVCQPRCFCSIKHVSFFSFLHFFTSPEIPLSRSQIQSDGMFLVNCKKTVFHFRLF